jgi:signal transduction histidine kinase
MTRLSRALAAAAVAAVLARTAPDVLVAQSPPASARRVLIINTFGNRFAPWDGFAAALRSEVALRWPGPVEFLETPLELARFAQPAEEGPFVDYLRALIQDRRLDLVVAVGGAAAGFAARNRERLFPSVPLLITGLDERRLAELPPGPNQVVSAIRLDPADIVESILEVLPGTRRLAMVLGDSPLEKFWRMQLEREFAAFAGRVHFTWLNTLPLEEMRRAVATLPPGSAVLYGTLNVDAAGVPHEEHAGLTAIRAATNAPVFGVFESQLGKGIVGGPLVSITDEGKRSAEVALAILGGKPVGAIVVPPRVPTRDLYDWRELHRWGIDVRRLPPGSEIRFRPPSVWEAYRRQALIGFGIVAVEAALIAALLAQRRRRRRVEERVRALNRRLITAQEDERSAIARELHDDLSQRLARLSIDAARLERSPGGDPAATAEIRGELSNLSRDVHALAYQLHPSTLEDLGLTEALRIECERVARLEALPVRLHASESSPELSKDAALCLFRVAQEALRNAARHARASAVDLSLETENGGARLAISDDGGGFDPAAYRGRPGLGLASMRERVELLGGTIDIRSAPGRGTTIDAWAPAAGRNP